MFYTKAAYGLVITTPFKLMTLSCSLSFKAQQWVGGGLNMVPQCWLARTLEATHHSQSPGSGFCLHAIFHSALCKNHDIRHLLTDWYKYTISIGHLCAHYFGAIICTCGSGKIPSCEMYCFAVRCFSPHLSSPDIKS